MRIPTVPQLAQIFAVVGAPIPAGVHILALRNRAGHTDFFDDMLLVLRGGKDILLACRCTTDPGKGPRMDPKNPAGCAVWAVGQVVDGLGLGKHHGQYECFVPIKPIPVLRYDSLEDVTGTPSTSTTTQIHRASADHESSVVGAWSEGCIVIANPGDFASALAAAKTGGQKRWTVTLAEWS